MNVLSTCRYLLSCELIQFYRSRSQLFYPLLLFVLITLLFPLAISSDAALLLKIAPGVLWVGVMLALLLSFTDLFHRDFQDGVLDQVILSDVPVSLYVFMKMIAHWVFLVMPLIVGSLFMSILYGMRGEQQWLLITSLLLGAPILMFLGAVISGLLVGMHRGGLLLPLLLLPLFIPVLIFGSGVAHAIVIKTPLFILIAMLVVTVTTTPKLIAAALKVGVSGC